MLMDYMKEIKEISAEQAIILWQASRLSLSKIYEKAPEMEKPRDFDPFGQTGLSPLATI